MSWISDAARTPPATRLVHALVRWSGGAVTEPMRLWGRRPRLLSLFLAFWKTLDRRRSPIPAGLRALLQVRISQLNVCAFCVDLTASLALARGVTDEKLEALEAFERSPLFTERERSALAFADAVTVTGGKVDAALRDRLRASWDEDAIVELAALISFQNMSSKFNFALDIPAQGFCRVPLRPAARAVQGAGAAAEQAGGAAAELGR